MRRSSYTGVFTLLALALGTAAAVVAAQEPPTFRFRERVTVLELVAEIEPGGAATTLRDAVSGRSATQLAIDEVELRFGEQTVPVTGIDPGSSGDGAWSFVLYLAPQLATSLELRWGATALSHAVSRLVELGSVELVFADPEPHSLLDGPSRDAAALEASLARVAVQGEGKDQISRLRHEYLTERSEPSLDLPAAELARIFADEETRLILEHQDALLAWLASGRESGPRRALFLVAGGYDPEPERFYVPAPAPRESSLASETEAFVRSLAAYGWATFPVLVPSPDVVPRGGLTLGKLRIRPSPAILGFAANYEEDRNPKRAAAYVRLGRSLRDQGRLADAAEAFERAIFHYYADRKTLAAEATAWAELAATHARSGRGDIALRALQQAVALVCFASAQEETSCAPTAEALSDVARTTALDLAAVQAARFEPLPLHEHLATATAGATIRDLDSLLEVVGDLKDRVRLSFQLAAPADGSLRPLELRIDRRAYVVRHPRWARSGTPERVAGARMRRLLGGAPEAGTLPLVVAPRSRDALVQITTAGPAQGGDDAPPGAVRITWGSGEPGGRGDVRHRVKAWQAGPAGGWSVVVPLPEMGEGEGPLAVLVEDLATQQWGSTFDLP